MIKQARCQHYVTEPIGVASIDAKDNDRSDNLKELQRGDLSNG